MGKAEPPQLTYLVKTGTAWRKGPVCQPLENLVGRELSLSGDALQVLGLGEFEVVSMQLATWTLT